MMLREGTLRGVWREDGRDATIHSRVRRVWEHPPMSCDVPHASYRPSIAPRHRSARGPSRHPAFPAPRVFFPKSHLFSFLPIPPSLPSRQPAGKKVAPTPSGMKAPKAEKKDTNPLFEKKPKVFGIGQALQPKTPLNRYVKWPKYVRIQRARRVLQKRLKVPPAIEQFNNTLDKNLATKLFKLLMKYRPEDDAQKKERLVATAAANEAGKEVESKKPVVVKFGINHITYLVEQGKAQLVCIAHDVDPIELVIWLPALCRQMNVPYCIVKGKARLGAVVHKKTATALALTGIKNEDKMEFSQLVEAIKGSYNDKFDKTMRTWGGGIMGVKSQAKTAARQRVIDKELKQREAI